MGKLRVFDPEVCKPEDYKLKYPELKRYKSFENLPGVRALIWVWYYANPTSPIRDKPKGEKAKEAFKRSGYNPSFKHEMIEGKFNDDFALAIEDMSNIDPGSRYRGYKMINKILNEYENIISEGRDAFKVIHKKEGKEEVSEVDTQKYVNTSAKIAEVIPSLVKSLEEGFAVTVKEDEEEGDDFTQFDEEYFKNK